MSKFLECVVHAPWCLLKLPHRRGEEWETRVGKAGMIKANAVLKDLAAISFADLADCYDDSNRQRPLHEIPFKTRRAIREVLCDRRTGEVIGFRFLKNVKALKTCKSGHPGEQHAATR